MTRLVSPGMCTRHRLLPVRLERPYSSAAAIKRGGQLMRLLNWAKEKIKAISDWHGRKMFGEVQRFNKVAPNVNPPTREDRKDHRFRLRFHRWSTMRTGGPVLTGERLRKAKLSCSPHNNTVQPRYRKVVRRDGMTIIECHCEGTEAHTH